MDALVALPTLLFMVGLSVPVSTVLAEISHAGTPHRMESAGTMRLVHLGPCGSLSGLPVPPVTK